jgi:TIR domain
MNLFLSWSGRVSQEVAMALRKWLPYMLHSVKPFMSTVDIGKGDKWSDNLSHELRGAQYGIVCVTPFNMHKPWMYFESGALAHLPHLSPVLFRVDRGALGHSPLAQFQLTEFGTDDDRSKTEFHKLIESINKSLPEADQLASEVLANNFDYWWPQFKKELDEIPETSVGETRTAYKWLRTFEDLAIHDLRADCDTVWFVTADVYKFALRAEVRAKIEVNLEKVKYHYLVNEPDSVNERAAKDELEELRRTHPGRLEYRCFKHEVFEQQATSDYVIIESSSSTKDRIKVFVRIPNGTEGEYWFETEERAAIGFYHRFLKLWESTKDMV